MAQRGFIHLREAWYAEPNIRDRTDGLIDEVMVGVYHERRGTDGEFRVAWYRLQDNRPPVPRLEVFSDGLHIALTEFADVMSWLAAHPHDFSAREFCDILVAQGVVDMTPYEPQQ